MKLTIKRLEKVHRFKLVPMKESIIVRGENYYYFDGGLGRCKCMYLGVNEYPTLGEMHQFQLNSENDSQETEDLFILNSNQVNKMIFKAVYQ